LTSGLVIERLWLSDESADEPRLMCGGELELCDGSGRSHEIECWCCPCEWTGV